MSYNPQFAKLGEILVNENMITEEQLNQALAAVSYTHLTLPTNREV